MTAPVRRDTHARNTETWQCSSSSSVVWSPQHHIQFDTSTLVVQVGLVAETWYEVVCVSKETTRVLCSVEFIKPCAQDLLPVLAVHQMPIGLQGNQGITKWQTEGQCSSWCSINSFELKTSTDGNAMYSWQHPWKWAWCVMLSKLNGMWKLWIQKYTSIHWCIHEPTHSTLPKSGLWTGLQNTNF